jgi:hypothetical protein
LEGENAIFSSVLIGLPSKRDKEVDDPSVVDERVKVDEEMEAA